MASIFKNNIEECIDVLQRATDLEIKIQEVIEILVGTIKSGAKIMLCGNGGSAADCQHFAAELTGRFVTDRKPLPAIALTTDTSVITCISNDYSFSQIFSRQILALGKQGDSLLVISTSGNSENAIQAVLAARTIGVNTIGLLGKSGGRLKDICDLAIVVDCESTARIQEVHLIIVHSICGEIEIRLGVV